MNDEYYEKMAENARLFHGPKTFMVSGYNREELQTLSAFLSKIGYEGTAVKPCTVEQLDETLETVLNGEIIGEPVGDGRLPNTMVLSGMTSNDVQLVMRRFKECDLKRPIFATTTPTNLQFTVKELLKHLLAEALAAGNLPTSKA